MLMIAFGKFKELKAKIFVDWFEDPENVKKLQEVIPDGATFKGAYLFAGGHADYDFEIHYEIENWAVLDKWRFATNERLKKFNEELARTLGIIGKWSRTRFLREVSDVTLLDPEIFKKD